MAKINLGILIESGHWFWQVDWFLDESPMQLQCSHVWDFLMRFIYSPWQRYWTVRSHLHSYPWFSWTQSQWWHQQRELWQKRQSIFLNFPWPLPPWSQGARYKEDQFRRSLAPPCSSGNECPCSQLGWGLFCQDRELIPLILNNASACGKQLFSDMHDLAMFLHRQQKTLHSKPILCQISIPCFKASKGQSPSSKWLPSKKLLGWRKFFT